MILFYNTLKTIRVIINILRISIKQLSYMKDYFDYFSLNWANRKIFFRALLLLHLFKRATLNGIMLSSSILISACFQAATQIWISLKLLCNIPQIQQIKFETKWTKMNFQAEARLYLFIRRFKPTVA